MSRALVIICSIISLTVLVTIILIACSLSVLSYNEVGLNYSQWFKTIENKTYEHGIKFIGLGHSFQRYDIKLNTIEFSTAPDATLPMIKCRTKDGLELDLEASLQYRVMKDNIYDIYTRYGTQEKPIMLRIIIDVISDTASQYPSDSFFASRTEIQQAMKRDLQARIAEDTFHEVVFFQLRSLALPDAFENEIENTEVKGQDILKATAESIRDQVKFDTNIDIAKLAVKSVESEANGQAAQTLAEARAIQSTIEEVTSKQAQAIKQLKANMTSIGATFDNDAVVKYLQYSLIKDYPEGRIALQFDS